jgi:hypothetical protein
VRKHAQEPDANSAAAAGGIAGDETYFRTYDVIRDILRGGAPEPEPTPWPVRSAEIKGGDEGVATVMNARRLADSISHSPTAPSNEVAQVSGNAPAGRKMNKQSASAQQATVSPELGYRRLGMNKRAAEIKVGRALVNRQTAMHVINASYSLTKEAMNKTAAEKLAAKIVAASFMQTLDKLAEGEKQTVPVGMEASPMAMNMPENRQRGPKDPATSRLAEPPASQYPEGQLAPTEAEYDARKPRDVTPEEMAQFRAFMNQ